MTDVSHSRHLKRLWLDQNLLEGSIPESIWTLTSLTELVLEYNKLNGSLPQQGTYHFYIIWNLQTMILLVYMFYNVSFYCLCSCSTYSIKSHHHTSSIIIIILVIISWFVFEILRLIYCVQNFKLVTTSDNNLKINYLFANCKHLIFWSLLMAHYAKIGHYFM